MAVPGAESPQQSQPSQVRLQYGPRGVAVRQNFSFAATKVEQN